MQRRRASRCPDALQLRGAGARRFSHRVGQTEIVLRLTNSADFVEIVNRSGRCRPDGRNCVKSMSDAFPIFKFTSQLTESEWFQALLLVLF